ncbi:MAG: M23 family metallopeptidase, partial [Chloroflexota bacterium]|nr:M23 family metallopeptidase [Chloroflexota bacterium]
WAALDFAPPVAMGCWPSVYPVRSVAPGRVIGSEEGQVWVDLDGDRDIRTGWVLLYMHIATKGRIEKGARVETGDVLGYPSCEGGVANGSHLHIARMYNGQWMPANNPVPFQLGNWVAEAVIGSSYDGHLVNTSDGRILEACDCRSARMNRFPERPRLGGP